MANTVKFLSGTEANYKALATKESGTFYQTENNLYLGDKKLTADAATDSNEVTQKPRSANIDYPILVAGSNTTTEEFVGTTGYVSVISANASKQRITAPNVRATASFIGNTLIENDEKNQS